MKDTKNEEIKKGFEKILKVLIRTGWTLCSSLRSLTGQASDSPNSFG